METSKNTLRKSKSTDLSIVLIKLLQGFVYQTDKKIWESIITFQESIREYFNKIGLYLHLDQEDGYAFLKEHPSSDNSDVADFEQIEENDQAPSLIRKIPLSFDVSLLCILIRESLESFDMKVSDDHRLILKKNDIYDQLMFFYPDKTDEIKLRKKFDASINKVIELGFLKELSSKTDLFEVKRVIKAFIDGKKVREIKEQMISFVNINESEVQELQ